MAKISFDIPATHHNKRIYADAQYIDNGEPKPIVIYLHGFKGFKDWGCNSLISDFFSESGFIFIKMNFSHSGVRPENPTEITDLEAFSENTFDIELEDIQQLIDHLYSDHSHVPMHEMDLSSITLIGHSRGGATAILSGYHNNRVNQVITIGAVSDLKALLPSEDKVEEWKREGIIHVQNSRTGQMLPLKYDLYTKTLEHYALLDVEKAARRLYKPFLIIHGDADVPVPVSHAHALKSFNPAAELLIVHDGDHTLGGKHPWTEPELPPMLHDALVHAMDFIFHNTPIH